MTSAVLLPSLLTLRLLMLAAEPTTNPQQPPRLDQQNIQRLKLEAQYAGLPIKQVRSSADVFVFARQNDQLTVATPLGELAEETRLLVKGLSGVIIFRSINSPIPGQPEFGGFNFQQIDFPPGSSVEMRTTVWTPLPDRVNIARDQESDQSMQSVQLIQKPDDPNNVDPSDPPLRLYIKVTNQLANKNEVDLTLGARSFTQLCLEHPQEVNQYLRPIFRDLQQEANVFAPDPRVVWQVLSADYKPPAQVAQQVKSVIVKLDSENFQEREQAMTQLQELGQPAALVLINLDRTTLSPQQQSGVDSFLAGFFPLGDDEVKRLREDRNFLLDSLSVEDATLRKLAWERLRAVTRTDEQFDPGADASTRAGAIAKLRQTIMSK